MASSARHTAELVNFGAFEHGKGCGFWDKGAEAACDCGLVALRDGAKATAERIRRLEDVNADMLAALKRVRYFHRTNDTPNSDPWIDVDGAIAKAEGCDR